MTVGKDGVILVVLVEDSVDHSALPVAVGCLAAVSDGATVVVSDGFLISVCCTAVGVRVDCGSVLNLHAT